MKYPSGITTLIDRLSGKGRVTRVIAGVLLTVVLLQACGSHSSSTQPGSSTPAAGDLVAWSQAVSLSAFILNSGISALGITGITASYGATCYRLTYRTPDVSGSLISASGLVCLPEGKAGSSPVISYQHGTIFQDSEAPSAFSTSPEGLVGALLGGLGFIVVLPDYIGFGDSSNEPHPYLHAATLASATVDMNRAARAFFVQSGINAATNGQFFLAGYSEGGFATLAAQRLMEESLSAEFPLTASEPGDGPYDLSATARYTVGLTNQVEPAFTGFFLKAYDSLYNTPSQISYYFAAAYVPIVNTYFTGTYSRSQISSALGGAGVATDVLLNRVFIASYLGSGETSLKAHVAENDIYNWAPKVPTRLFHGTGDDIVPYANAVTAQTTMMSNGSTSVTIVNCNAGTLPTTHDNCAQPYAVDLISYFKTLARDL